jgi:hypothetical protein
MEDRTFFITHKHIDSALSDTATNLINLIRNDIKNSNPDEPKRDYNIYEIFIPFKLINKTESIIGGTLFSSMFIEEKRVFPNLEKIRISDSVEFDFTVDNSKKKHLTDLITHAHLQNLSVVATVKCCVQPPTEDSYTINSIKDQEGTFNIFTGIFEFKNDKDTIIKNILELSDSFIDDLNIHLYTLPDVAFVSKIINITPFLKRPNDKQNINFLEYIKEYIKRTPPDIIQDNKMYRLRLLNDSIPPTVPQHNIINHLSPEIVYTIKPYEIALENIIGKVLKNKYLLIDDDNYEQLGLDEHYSPI